MKNRLPYIFAAFIALVLGVLLLTVFKDVSVIRNNMGDFLIVIFLYALLKTVFPSCNYIKGLSLIFIFAVCVEFIQYFKLPQYFDTKHFLIIVTVGSTFDPLDILFYAAGCIAIGIIEYLFLKNKKQY